LLLTYRRTSTSSCQGAWTQQQPLHQGLQQLQLLRPANHPQQQRQQWMRVP
jgi:hypothetical protein